MGNTTIGFGIVLILIGVISFAVTGGASWTALIPSIFGLLMLSFGILARNERMRKHAMHSAAAVGLLGFLGSAGGVLQVVQMLQGQEVQRPEAAIARTIMALVCLAFVVLTVKSFIAARQARTTD